MTDVLPEGEYSYYVDDVKESCWRETEYAPSHFVFHVYITIYDGKDFIKSEFDIHKLASQSHFFRRFADNVGLYGNIDLSVECVFDCKGHYGYAHFFEGGKLSKFINAGDDPSSYWG